MSICVNSIVYEMSKTIDILIAKVFKDIIETVFWT